MYADLSGGAFYKLLRAVSLGSLHGLLHHRVLTRVLQKRIQISAANP